MNPDDLLLYNEVRDTVIHWGSKNNYALKIHWKQTGIFGKYCPNGIAGCAPLAIASIAAHLNYLTIGKSEIKYDFPGRDVDADSITWQQFLVHDREYTDGTLKCWEKDKEGTHNAIGRVLRQIGYDCGSSYDVLSTGTSPNVYREVLKKYVPNAVSIGQLTNFESYKVMRLIDKGLLLMRSSIKGSNSGHAWVADGYEYVKVDVKCYERDSETHEMKYLYTQTEETSLTSFKWGWGGKEDGYFANNVFEANGQTYDAPQYISVQIR